MATIATYRVPKVENESMVGNQTLFSSLQLTDIENARELMQKIQQIAKLSKQLWTP